MQVGIIADIHDNAHNAVIALQELEKKKVEKILFLGDFAGAAIANILMASPVPIFAVWGNNDGDKALITKFSFEEGSNLEIGFDTYDTIELGGRKIFMTHYPVLARSMAKSGDFDAVFYGHDHTKHKEKVSDCLVMNPGEIGAYASGIGSYAIYDTETNDAEIIDIEGAITTNTKEAQKRFDEIKFKWSSLRSHKKK